MIFGIGTDIIETARIEKQLSKIQGLQENLFSVNEIQYCNSKKHPFQHFAARYAAKESFLKAIGTGWRDGIKFPEIEIVNDDLGKPMIKLSGFAKILAEKNKFLNIQVSMSHIKDMVTATVIIETE